MDPMNLPFNREGAVSELEIALVRTVVIGRQEWTVANLNLAWPGSWAPNGDETLVEKYGRLYTYDMAVEIASKVMDWRLPTREDVETMISTVGGSTNGAAALKPGGATGFDALYAGFREPDDDSFRRTGKQTGFWTGTAAHDEEAWKFWIRVEDDNIMLRPVSRQYGDSIRLVRER